MIGKKTDVKKIESMENFHSWIVLAFKLKKYDYKKNGRGGNDSRDDGLETVKEKLKQSKATEIDYVYLDFYTTETRRQKQIRDGHIVGDTSPCPYGGNDCWSDDCKKKYGPKGCGFSLIGEKEDQENKNKQTYWFHDREREKITTISKGYNRNTMQYTGKNTIHINNLPDSVMIDDPKRKGRSMVRTDIGLSDMDENLAMDILDIGLLTTYLTDRGRKLIV